MYKTFDESQEKLGSKSPFWGEGLLSAFGLELLIAVFICYHLMSGLNLKVVSMSKGYVFEHYGVNAADSEIFTVIERMTWAFLPTIGIISDAFPVRGYRKAPYMFFFIVVGAACALLLGLDTHFLLPIKVVVMFFFLITLQGSTCSFFVSAQLAVKIKEFPREGPDLMLFRQIGYSVMAAASAFIVPVMLDRLELHSVYWIVAIGSSIALWPLACNYLGEYQVSLKETQFHREELVQNWQRLMSPMAMLVIGILFMIVANMSISATHMFVISWVLLAVMCAALYLTLGHDTAHVAVFFAIHAALGVNIEGAEFYFWNDTALQYPEGPHVSKEEFVTLKDNMGFVGALMGLVFYGVVLKNWRYRDALLFVQVMVSLGFLSKAITYSRLNLALGLPDIFMMVASQMCVEFPGVQSLVLTELMWARACPPGEAGSTMAIMLGGSQLGHTVGRFFGSSLFEKTGVLPAGSLNESSQFDNLWIGACLQALLPIVWVVFFAPIMIPDIKQTEVLVDSGDQGDSGAGSLLARGSADV